MPQMSPYNWLILFILFNMIMTYLISINYFTHTPPTPKINTYTTISTYKFKWMW